jgi:hypothetical protein
VTVQGIQIELRRMQERAIQESTIITFDIYLMDAMGMKHRIPMSMARTFEVCALEANQKISLTIISNSNERSELCTLQIASETSYFADISTLISFI